MITTTSNKIALAVLGTLLAVMATRLVAEGVFSHPKLEVAGYILKGAEAEGKGGGKEPVLAASLPLPQMMASADAKRGEAGSKPCLACHSFEKGAVAKVGPPLYGVVGRPMASIAGFSYSEGMKAKGGNWTLEALNSFIASPKAYVTGTKMAYPGQPEDSKRGDILGYLNSLSDNPAPLPK